MTRPVGAAEVGEGVRTWGTPSLTSAAPRDSLSLSHTHTHTCLSARGSSSASPWCIRTEEGTIHTCACRLERVIGYEASPTQRERERERESRRKSEREREFNI